MAVAISFLQSTSAATASSTVTFSTQSIGTAADDRIVVACIGVQADCTISSVTIGGISATKVIERVDTAGSPDLVASMWAAKVPTGTTANVVVNLSANNDTVSLGLYRMTGATFAASDTDSAAGSAATISVSSVTIPSNGGAIFSFTNDTRTTAVTWTNATEGADDNVAGGSATRFSTAHTTTAGTPTVTADGATAAQALVGAAWSEYQALTPSLFTNSAAFNTHTITTGAVDLTASLFSNTPSFYTPTVDQPAAVQQDLTQSATFVNTTLFANDDDDFFYEFVTTQGGAQNLTASLFTNSNTFYSHTLTTTYALTASLFTNSNTFYTHTLSSVKALTASLFTNSNSFYSHTLTVGAVNLSPSLFTNSNTFYTHTRSGLNALTASLVTNSNSFYAATATSVKTLTPSLFTDADTFYTHTRTSANTLSASLFTDADTFPSATVSGNYALLPPVLIDGDTFYTPRVAGANANVVPSLFTNSSTFYSLSLTNFVPYSKPFFTKERRKYQIKGMQMPIYRTFNR